MATMRDLLIGFNRPEDAVKGGSGGPAIAGTAGPLRKTVFKYCSPSPKAFFSFIDGLSGR